MHITPIGSHLGAQITDVQLNNLLPEQFQQIYQAFLQYKVLFFPKQTLSAQQHLDLACEFGELEPVHPFFPHLAEADQIVVLEVGAGKPPGKSFWHTDLSWQAIPCKCSLLHAHECPEGKGDTIWSSMEAVWQSLSANEQQQLRNFTALHQLHAFEGSRYDSVDHEGNSKVATASRNIEPVLHPMVIQHPETGKESLFINEQFTSHIIGLDPQDSKRILTKLFQMARKEEFQVRLQWQVGTLAIWDNRCTQHLAITDYGEQPRRLHRVSVQGERLLASSLGKEK